MYGCLFSFHASPLPLISWISHVDVIKARGQAVRCEERHYRTWTLQTSARWCVLFSIFPQRLSGMSSFSHRAVCVLRLSMVLKARLLYTDIQGEPGLHSKQHKCSFICKQSLIANIPSAGFSFADSKQVHKSIKSKYSIHSLSWLQSPYIYKVFIAYCCITSILLSKNGENIISCLLVSWRLFISLPSVLQTHVIYQQATCEFIALSSVCLKGEEAEILPYNYHWI